MVSKKRTKTRRLRGGKYIAEGAYGCGSYPALRCEGDNEREVNVFSKLMEYREARHEYDIAENFRPIDPDQKYFLYPFKLCPINKAVLPNPENNVGRCVGKFSDLDHARLLQYKNGGLQLDTLKLTPVDYIPFFVALKQLFEGIDKLHDGNVAHMDIKESNIVHLKEPDGKYHIRYIDFGLSLKPSKKLKENVYGNDYFVWPYDTRFLVGSFKKSKISNGSVTDFLLSQQYDQTYYPWELYWKSNGDAIVDKYTFRDIWDRIVASISKKKIAPFLAKKTDIYSLGRLISKVYSKNVGHFARLGYTRLLNPNDPTTKITLADLQPIVSADIYLWHKNVFENITTPFTNLIKGMMAIDPTIRIDSKSALAQYTDILEQIKIYFDADRVRTGFGIYFPHLLAAAAPPPPPAAPPGPITPKLATPEPKTPAMPPPPMYSNPPSVFLRAPTPIPASPPPTPLAISAPASAALASAPASAPPSSRKTRKTRRS